MLAPCRRSLVAAFARRRGLATSVARLILNQNFALTEEWKHRHAALRELSVGGSYEWLSSVQKKYVGGGQASAVDVDIAACISEHSDQLGDVVDVIYKLRHTENASDLLPSTEYAVLRALLRERDTATLFRMLNDPINYGVFPNEHVCCMLMDHFLDDGNVAGAARLATIAMQQEMFENPLLNLLAVHSLLKWAELPAEKRTYDEHAFPGPKEEEEINEDDERTFRYPFLKNPYFDDHFDLIEPNQLVGKALELLPTHIAAPVEAVEQCRRSLPLISRILRGKHADAVAYASELGTQSASLPQSAVTLCTSLVEQQVAAIPEESRVEGNADFDALSEIQKSLGTLSAGTDASTAPLSEQFLALVKAQISAESEKLSQWQKEQFVEWNRRRRDLVQAQAERLNLRLRINEIKEERKKLDDEKEILFFFDNRVKWDDMARQKDELFEELHLHEKSAKHTEEEYARELFEITKKEKVAKAS